VVGGPTGAGKSTLLNSLVRAPVSTAGVLRPTTRRPVLVCNPGDWASVRRYGLRPICAPLMPEGIAVIDAPDLDSIEPANRAVAGELFAEADLWLFVTTASRYADAANWRHLRAARERRVALAVVLDRVAAGHAQGIVDHMRDLLGPPEPPMFLIPESPLDGQGMLPDSIAAPLRGWLADVVYAARSGPPRPAIGVAHVPVQRSASPADLAPPGTRSFATAADVARSSIVSHAGDGGLTVELELTPGPAPSSPMAQAPRDEPTAESGSGQSGQEPEGPVPDGDGDGVPDTELTPARPLTSDDIETEEEAEVAEDTDTETDVVESDPPDGRRPDIPKGADVGETVKL
jgi:hypothetical protein